MTAARTPNGDWGRASCPEVMIKLDDDQRPIRDKAFACFGGACQRGIYGIM